MTGKRLVLIVSLALLGSTPATALGSKSKFHVVKPTAAQRAGILRAFGHPSKPNAACLNVWLAASNHSYGTVRYKTIKSCRRYAFNGVNVFKRVKDNRWKQAFAGSSYSCPVPRIPRKVQRDLAVCP